MDDTIFSGMPKEKIADYLDALPTFEPTQIVETDFTMEDVYASEEPMLPMEVPEPKTAIVLKAEDHGRGLDGDFDVVRENLLGVVSKQNDILEDMITLARCSESPRAWEVVSTMINTLTTVNEKLLAIHEKREDINKKKSGGKGGTQQAESITNNQFNLQMSTTDMLEFLKKNGI
jgi:hypothetical protein